MGVQEVKNPPGKWVQRGMFFIPVDSTSVVSFDNKALLVGSDGTIFRYHSGLALQAEFSNREPPISTEGDRFHENRQRLRNG